jgi:hypothetical protein
VIESRMERLDGSGLDAIDIARERTAVTALAATIGERLRADYLARTSMSDVMYSRQAFEAAHARLKSAPAQLTAADIAQLEIWDPALAERGRQARAGERTDPGEGAHAGSDSRAMPGRRRDRRHAHHDHHGEHQAAGRADRATATSNRGTRGPADPEVCRRLPGHGSNSPGSDTATTDTNGTVD